MEFLKARSIYHILILSGIIGIFWALSLTQSSDSSYSSNPDITSTVNSISLLAILLGIAGLIVINKKEDRNRIKEIASLINKNNETSSKKLEEKISKMLGNLDRVRNYKRHIWGIGDFTPLIRIRRYVRPSTEILHYINELEHSLIKHIAIYKDEKSVDEALDKATEVADSLIKNLNKAK
jgi:hypothetical protein